MSSRGSSFFHRAGLAPTRSCRPPDWPKYLLLYDAMELALKAYLIQCGVSEKDLKDEGGHDLKNLVDEAVNRGLSLPAGSKEMIPRWLDEGFGLSPILWTAALIARWPRPPRSAHPL
jgi:hypothetical protein